jgi:hypothetical protein
MLTDEVGRRFGELMKTTRGITALLLLMITAATACTAERAISPQPSAPSFSTFAATTTTQVPLLFVVDGVRNPRDQVPLLTPEQIFAVYVLNGHAALKQFGPDASYGVVVITTKQAAGPRS